MSKRIASLRDNSFGFKMIIAPMALSYIVGLFLALLLNRDIKFRGLFRAAALIPWIIPPIVATTNWSWVLNDQYGIINTILLKIGLVKEPVLFLAVPDLARITVIGVGVWKSYPFMMIVLLAGLQGIPKEQYEAAYMDGAGFFKSFFRITMPNLKNVSFICTILMFIWTFNNFENIYLLTHGGPVKKTFVLSILSYYMAFFRGTLGYASAITTITLVILLMVSIVYLRALKADRV
ncbi:MAG: sugar ABC transporter permease [Deltaproteobacteria bacterium]|nr:sugar ABC transporter permease [Deltaproteobacteria bacterium]